MRVSSHWFVSQAYLWSILILLLILVSTISMLVATLPEYDNDSSQQDFFVVESVCIAIFTLEVCQFYSTTATQVMFVYGSC